MLKLTHVAAIAASILLISPAYAGGKASPPPPKAPEVDFSTLPASAAARPPSPDKKKEHPVLARLLLENQQIVAGETARIGVHLEQAEGWHTYWKSPGDVGQPTEITWTTPTGVQIPEQTHAIPQRFEQEKEVSFGYDDEVLHIATFDVPAELAVGTHPFKAKVHWLVCLTSCIPGDVELTLPVEVVAPGTAVQPTPWQPLFTHYAAQHPTDPVAIDSFGWDFSLSQSAIRPNDEFKAVFRVQARDGHTVSKHKGDVPWPTFTPFVPFDWAWAPDDVQVINADDGSLLVAIKATAYEPDPIPTDARIGGLFQVEVDGEWVRAEIDATLPWAAAEAAIEQVESPLLSMAFSDDDAAGDAAGGDAPPVEGATDGAAAGAAVTGAGLLYNLLFAFIGGLILNIMPCVLPVLTLKLYSLVEQTDITPKEQQTAGLAYTGGILVSFWALAASIVALRAAFGMQVDWGFQFQYPPYVAALATIVFAFGLSLFGVFEIPAFGVGSATEATAKEGVVGYFFTGVFATLLATPCSAPFLGTAAAFAFGAPTIVLFGIFSMVGFGLAFPFLVIAFVPAAYRLLPRPGAWMEGFKQLLGFSLIATTVWLVGVLASQVGAGRTIDFMAFLTCVAVGCWMFGRWGGVAASSREQLRALAMGGAVALLGGWYFVDLAYAEEADCDDGSVTTDLAFDEHIPWQPFSGERVEALAGTPVFVDFTADWCLTCKANERLVLDTPAVREALATGGYVPLMADWTRPDEEIASWLHRFGRAGVPMYLIIPADPNNEPFVLPETITKSMVIEALKKGAGGELSRL